VKPYALAVPFIALFAGAAVASAPPPVTQEISVTATIPGNDFSVEPIGDWMQRGVELEYQPQTEELTPVTERFNAQSDVGPIQASLVEPAVLREQKNSDQIIELAITVGGQPLASAAVEVMNAEDAKDGNELPITFAAVKPGEGYAKGDYSGVVKVLFETSSSSL